jgi:glycosyltransferase involved in cell wall biosynthesis
MKIDVFCYDDIKNPRCGGGGALRELSVHRFLSSRHAIRFYTGNFKGSQNKNEFNFIHRHLGIQSNYLLSRLSFSILASVQSLFSKADIIALPYSIYSPVLTFLFKPQKTVVLFFHITGMDIFKKYGIFGVFPWLAEQIVLLAGKNYITLTDSMAQSIFRRRPNIKIKAGYVSFDPSLLNQSGSDEKFILCFGRIDIHMKGIDILIPAFEQIAEKFFKHRLVIAGRGKETDIDWLKQRIKKSPYRSKIEHLINVPDDEKRKLYCNASFVCMPSRFEGWNIAAIEAAASSKATIGSRIPGLIDAIRENETGLLVERENVAELAEKMGMLLNDTALRDKLGKNGHEWARQFTLERIAGIQENFYLEIAKLALQA